MTGYLEALAGNDADAALAYSAEPLTSGGTLSSKVLAASNRRAKLTGIEVPEVTDVRRHRGRRELQAGRAGR